MKQNIVDFKAKSFLSERNMSTMAYEVKAVRALWDPSLSIPGTNRRGGWRCPTGTRYGGQITDRFGRSCGWGVARRIANQISDIGSRLENVDDARRGRRIARRERRILARLNPQDARAGRLERGLRGVAERLDGGEAPTPRGGRRRAVTARTPSVDTPEAPRELTPAPRAPRRRRAPARRQPDGGNLRESEERRMEREIEQPGAPRTGEAPARRRRRAVVETVSKPKAPVKKPEAVVEPKVVKPRRPKPIEEVRAEAARQADAILADADRERAFAFNTPESFANAFMPEVWGDLSMDERKEFKDQWNDEVDALNDVARNFAERILDDEFGDPDELRERVSLNNEEIRNDNKRLERDRQLFRDLQKPAPLERQRIVGQNRRDALSRIAVNAQDRRRRELENKKFQEAIDNASANGKPAPVRKNVDIGDAPGDFALAGNGRWTRGAWIVTVDREDERVLGLTATNGRGGLVLARNFNELVERMNGADRRPQLGNSDNAARSEELRQNREAAAQAAVSDAKKRKRAKNVRPLGNPNNFIEIAGRLNIRGNDFPSGAYERLHDEWDEGEAKIDAAEELVREQIEDFAFGQNVPEAGMRLRISQNVDDMLRGSREIERDLALLEPIINDASKSSQRGELARKIIYNQQEVRFLRRVNNILEREIEELENLSTPSSARRMNDTIDSGERSSKPSATTPKPPKAPARPRIPVQPPAPARRAQNALPQGWNQGPGTIITHSNGDIIDQPIGSKKWFVVHGRPAQTKTGFDSREDAIAWHKQNVLNAPAAPAIDPIDAPFIAPDKKDIRNAPEALKHQPPKVEPAKFKAEQEQIIEEALLEIRDAASLNKFSLLVDQAIFNENEGRQGALRNFQKELTKVAEILKRDPDYNIDALIAEQKRQYLANFQMRGGVANARTKLNELETQLRDKFIKLRTPPGNGAEEKERSRLSLMEDIANIKKSIGSYEGHLQLVDALEPEIRKASDRIKQGFVFDPDATNIPKPTPADVKKKIKDQISAAIDRRQGKLAKYLEERYPNGGAQFQDMTPEKWRTLTISQKNEYIKEGYGHPVIKGKNGKLYNAVASVNGGSVEVVFNEINAQGQIIRARIGTSSRSISFGGGEVYQASMFISSKLDRGADIQTIYNQHAFLYLSKIGITKAKVNAADDGQYVWARVGFKRGSGLGRGDLRALEAPLKFYEDFGPGGLISNDAEYARIKSTLTQAAGGTKFSHQDIIFALDDPTGDKPRMEYVKQWFKPNLGFPGGVLKFADQKVGGTPPRRPRRARAPRVPANGGV